MNVLLINPKICGRGQASVKYMNSVPLALPLLAALTPPDIDVEILDENARPIDYDRPADLVGITVMHHLSPQAIGIAREFRRRGVPVVMGGMYPTIWPAQALAHADAIVVGEGEPVWRQLLDDARGGRLKRRYQHDGFIDLKAVPFIPARLMRDQDFYHAETGRGCPNHCDFCCVAKVHRGTLRQRPVADVVAQVAELTDKMVFFVDDNLAGDRDYAKRLLKELIPLNLSWSGQFTLDAADDAELLELSARSGCKFMFCGIETLSEDGLKEANKSWSRPERYPEWIRRIHDAGIAVYGSFMFGFDSDGPSVFEETLAFAEANRIDLALFSAIFPVEGSAMHRKLMRENRIFQDDISKYNGQYATFHPKRMSAEELDAGLRWIWQQFYSKKSIMNRIGHYFPDVRGFIARLDGSNRRNHSTKELMAALNLSYKTAVKRY